MKHFILLTIFFTGFFVQLRSMHLIHQGGVQICDQVNKSEVCHILMQVQSQIDLVEKGAAQKESVAILVNASRNLYTGAKQPGEYTLIYYQAKGELEAVSSKNGDIINYAGSGCKITEADACCTLV